MAARRAKRTLIRGGHLVTPRGFARADLLVDGDRIARIGPELAPSRGDRLIDAGDHVVVPGLISARTHLVTTAMRGLARGQERSIAMREHVWPAELELDAAAVREAAIEGARELLLAGVTTVLDAGAARHAGEVLAALSSLGMRGAVGRALLDRGQGLPPKLREPAALEAMPALIERWHGADEGRLRVALAPRSAAHCSPALLARVGHLSESHGLLVTMPYAETQADVALAREVHGGELLSTLASPRLVVAHGTWLPSEAQRCLRERGGHVAHCPSADLAVGNGVAKIPELMRAGVAVAMGSGDASATFAHDPWAELRLASLLPGPRHGVVSPREALDWATIGGARALGLGEGIGALEPGRKADLVVMRLGASGARDVIEAVVLGGRAADVRHVLVDGVPRVRNGKPTG